MLAWAVEVVPCNSPRKSKVSLRVRLKDKADRVADRARAVSMVDIALALVLVLVSAAALEATSAHLSRLDIISLVLKATLGTTKAETRPTFTNTDRVVVATGSNRLSPHIPGRWTGPFSLFDDNSFLLIRFFISTLPSRCMFHFALPPLFISFSCDSSLFIILVNINQSIRPLSLYVL
jgi:hypothetical protein